MLMVFSLLSRGPLTWRCDKARERWLCLCVSMSKKQRWHPWSSMQYLDWYRLIIYVCMSFMPISTYLECNWHRDTVCDLNRQDVFWLSLIRCKIQCLKSAVLAQEKKELQTSKHGMESRQSGAGRFSSEMCRSIRWTDGVMPHDTKSHRNTHLSPETQT